MRRILTVAALLLLAAAAPAQQRWAVVNTSCAYLYASPDYESGLETQSLMGTVVEVLGEDRYWRKVSTPDPYVAWTNDLMLAYMTEEEKDAYIAAPKWICTVENTYIYAGPEPGAGRIADFTMGGLVRKAEGMRRGKVEVLLPSGERGWVRRSEVEDFGLWARSRTLSGENLVATAKKFLGVPYLWGGISSKGFDCSGLVKFCYMMNGVLLMRNASQQVHSGEELQFLFAAMQPGDLLFFGTPATGSSPMKVTHVGMYIGDGRMIHSSMVVRINSLCEDDPDYYGRTPVAVRRLIGSVGTEGVTAITDSPWYFRCNRSGTNTIIDNRK